MARVVIIEDEAAITMVLQEVLRGEGYDAVSAPDGAAGLALMAAGPRADLVLVDLFMPVLDGRGVVTAMRSDPNLAGIPVVCLSGLDLSDGDFPPAGTFAAVIAKPFNLSHVLEVVGRVLKAPGR